MFIAKIMYISLQKLSRIVDKHENNYIIKYFFDNSNEEQDRKML